MARRAGLIVRTSSRETVVRGHGQLAGRVCDQDHARVGAESGGRRPENDLTSEARLDRKTEVCFPGVGCCSDLRMQSWACLISRPVHQTDVWGLSHRKQEGVEKGENEWKGKTGAVGCSVERSMAHRRHRPQVLRFVRGPVARNLVAPTCTADATYLWLTENELGESVVLLHRRDTR